jgi:glycosyltransferase involved in cell wall biosynthesis
LRITHLNPYRIGAKGGVEVYIDSLIYGLLKHRFDAQCFVGGRLKSHSPNYQQYRSYLDQSTNDFDVDKFIDLCWDAFVESTVIQLHNFHLFQPLKKSITFINRLLGKSIDAKLILDVHNLRDDSESWDIIKTFGKNNVIAHSDFIADKIAERTDFRPMVLSYCFPCEISDLRTAKPTDSIDILQPTRFAHWKGSHLSLRAAVELLDLGYSNFTFTHAAIRPSRLAEKWDSQWQHDHPRLLEKVSKYVENGKIFLEEYRYHDFVGRIAKSDIILHPTIGTGIMGEPFSIAVAQSIITERAIIVSNSGYLPILANPSYYSPIQIVQAGDYEMLLDALKQWLGQPLPQPTAQSQQYAYYLKNQCQNSVEEHITFYEKEI